MILFIESGELPGSIADKKFKSQLSMNKWLYSHLGITRASLSRTYRRLEERGLIHKIRRRWRLTDDNGKDSPGNLIALLELQEYEYPELKRERLLEERRDRRH